MPTMIRDLKITSVDSVDRGAGRGVKVVFWKRHEEDPEMKIFDQGDVLIAKAMQARTEDGVLSIAKSMPYREDIERLQLELAERQRENETVAQAFATFVDRDPLGRQLNVIKSGLPFAPDALKFARLQKMADDEPRPAKPQRTAAMHELDKIVDEHHEKNPHLSREQSFAHVVTGTDRGRHLFAADKKQRGIMAEMA
jgi:hypothetical protein